MNVSTGWGRRKASRAFEDEGIRKKKSTNGLRVMGVMDFIVLDYELGIENPLSWEE